MRPERPDLTPDRPNGPPGKQTLPGGLWVVIGVALVGVGLLFATLRDDDKASRAVASPTSSPLCGEYASPAETTGDCIFQGIPGGNGGGGIGGGGNNNNGGGGGGGNGGDGQPNNNNGGGNGGGGDPAPAPEQPDSHTNTVAWKLATIDAEGPVSKTDPRVFDYADALGELQERCQEGSIQLGNEITAARNLLAERGKVLSNRRLIAAGIKSIPRQLETPCSDIFASLVVLIGG